MTPISKYFHGKVRSKQGRTLTLFKPKRKKKVAVKAELELPQARA